MIRQSTIDRHVGTRYGMLTVLSFSYQPRPMQYFYRCRCDCGIERDFRLSSLQQGSSKSCGHAGKEARLKANVGNTYRRGVFGESSVSHAFCRLRLDAARRGYSFELTREEFGAMVRRDCFYCDSAPATVIAQRNGYGHAVVNGVDRVDNSIGYSSNNTVPCCKSCNSAKNAVTKEMIRRAYHYLAAQEHDALGIPSLE